MSESNCLIWSSNFLDGVDTILSDIIITILPMKSFVFPQTVHTDLTFFCNIFNHNYPNSIRKACKTLRATDTEKILEIITQVALIITFDANSDYFGV